MQLHSSIHLKWISKFLSRWHSMWFGKVLACFVFTHLCNGINNFHSKTSCIKKCPQISSQLFLNRLSNQHENERIQSAVCAFLWRHGMYVRSDLHCRWSCVSINYKFYLSLFFRYGTAKSAIAISSVSVMRPDLIMKLIIPVSLSCCLYLISV